ncbi:class I SAM-dependent methyltransferase [Pseudovibrio sp. Tun.PSC04-5.I4]|uniref:class I SAM-dependent methyltransferase n=1 Tax=Pseudovibrio sp. Tun.PSC04-5.I4 TaxID=1798213 RepID=UPI000883747D|nr:class I SAM-dependent methyltransferase [Pseudovibrio sp. Tun.PSC04-5.I4]SDQ94646.1 Methyltransferase domain-containing protein [Pseudovibrio sp. Tun.PSC04-5.I4]
MELPEALLQLSDDEKGYLLQQRTDLVSTDDLEMLQQFRVHLARAVERMRVFLPVLEGRGRFLDIGCGLGFGLLALKEVYGGEHSYCGLDKNGFDEEIQYGFKKKPEVYNDLECMRAVLEKNGIPSENIQSVDISAQEFPEGPFDVVSSHIAWGWHFPVAAYLDQVEAVTRPGTVIYMDIRHGTNGVAEMAKRFQLIWANEKKKGVRTMWRVN